VAVHVMGFARLHCSECGAKHTLVFLRACVFAPLSFLQITACESDLAASWRRAAEWGVPLDYTDGGWGFQVWH
jgi:hypothetical protein